MLRSLNGGVLALLLTLLSASPLRAQVPLDGFDAACTDFKLLLLDLGLFDIDPDIPDEGWVWVHRGNPSLPIFADVSGLVTKSQVSAKDTPANHDSHDQNTFVLVDPGQEGILSLANRDDANDPRSPDTIEIEWEIGIRPGEKSGDGAAPMFARWAWPSRGDRFWANGHWVFDCGHPTDINGMPSYRSEIHPPRAIASMRNQARALPGSGSTPVPVTATDLYVHGVGGYVVDQLNCGMDIMLADDPESCPVQTSPIAENFEFDVCLPPRPAATALLAWQVLEGPGNEISVEPIVEVVSATDACANGSEPLDLESMLHVTVPLAGAGVADEAVYARQIHAGWVFPPETPLQRMQVSLTQMDLHDDHEIPAGNGEMTFFWLNVDRAPTEWFRLVDFQIPTDDDSAPIVCGFSHTNTLNDYDSDASCGNGLLDFSGPNVDFYVREGQDFSLFTTGYEQDCTEGAFGDHDFTIGVYVTCFGGNPLSIVNWGRSDAMASLSATFGPSSNYGVGVQDITAGGEYELVFDIAELPPGEEDDAELSVTKSCSFEGEVPLVGRPIACTVVVDNAGPGLPRDVRLEDDLVGLPAGSFTVTATSFQTDGSADSFACSTTTGGFSCDLGTVPVGRAVTVASELEVHVGGAVTNRAEVSTASNDTRSADDVAESELDVFVAVAIDVRPGGSPNPLRIGARGAVPVGALTAGGIDARQIDVSSLCFGDAEAPGERDCTVAHAGGHLEDLDGDGDDDLLVHFQIDETGVDGGDESACLRGALADGTGIFGCDAIVTR